MKPPARLHPPASWDSREGDGFVVHADPLRQSTLAFALSVAAGLDGRPRRLDARYLYDAAGSALFERITVQPEYYLTAAEERLLAEGARAIREIAGPGTLVELGAGAATKTQRLLDAWCAAGPAAYVPVDVDLHGLEQTCTGLRRRYPSLPVEGVAASYERALPLLHGMSPLTVAFLGSSLGNLGWSAYPEFCQMLADALADGDHFLVGLDLVKPAAALEAAYNDAAGVTAAFTRNLFARMNRELLTDISLDAIEHVAFYDPESACVEIFAEARRELVIHVPVLGRDFRIARRERILTEVSQKFRADAVTAEIERFGFRLVWSDVGDGRFGVFLFRRSPTPRRAPRATRNDVDPADLLAEARTRTLDLVAPLGEDDLRRQHNRLMSPIAWDLGHIAHFEESWLLRDGAGLDDGVYDPLATPRAGRDQLPLPTVAAIRGRMDDVRARVAERLGAASAAGQLPFHLVTLVAEHEAQHQETILQAIALREDLDYRPSFIEERPAPGGARAPADSVAIPAGPFLMGTDDRSWAYDNERPAHQVDVPAFRIDRSPVTNRQYLAFMGDHGYARPELWSEAGWNWRGDTGARAPAHWRQAAPGADPEPSRTWAGGWQALVFGRLVTPHPDSPVIHVSWYEADAYARWSGGRLPSEAEWEKAAAWDPARGAARRFPWGDEPWEAARANIDQRHLEPAPAGAYPAGRSAYGCLQMLGDVWEWTASWFDGYPGYVSFPYKEYSEIFFGKTYRVLRGASFATRSTVARATMRNWDLPERRQIFAGFRCVKPA